MKHTDPWNSRRSPGGGHFSRWRGVHRALPSIVVLIALLTATGVLAAVIRNGVAEHERELLRTRGADAAKLAETFSERFFEALERAELVDRETRGRPAEFVARMRPQAVDTVAISMALVRLDPDGRARVMVNVTDRPPSIISRLGGDAERFRAAARVGAERTAVLERGPMGVVLGWVTPGGSPDRVIYSEVDVAQSIHRTFAEETLVAGALYLGPVESPLSLLGATSELPVPAPRDTRTVDFGGAQGLLVLHAREPLVGVWANRMWWLVLGLGLVLAAGVTGTIEWIRRSRDRMTYRATHDELTGLAGRALFAKRLDHALVYPGAEQRVGVAVIDLDDFKLVNDSLGHAAGDALLVETARRLQAAMPARGLCARVGGDEFAVLLADHEGDPARVASALQAALEAPFRLPDREATIRASIGIAFAGWGDWPAEVIRNADIAMYRAKGREHGASWEVFAPEMLTHATERMRQVDELREAVRKEAFELHYQPIVDFPGGEITAVEALLRWRHPERGLLAPGSFIRVAEETALIVEIGTWVLREACRQAAVWRRQSPSLRVSVNVSGRQLLDVDFAQVVLDALGDADLPCAALALEVTESYLLSASIATKTLARLADLGVMIAVDDFGSGYSSIGYLRRLPVNVLKIDRAFVPTHPSTSDGELLAAIVQMAKTFGLLTVGEGIETHEQLDMAIRAGCDRGQGFLFARPAPADELTEFITARVSLRASARTGSLST